MKQEQLQIEQILQMAIEAFAQGVVQRLETHHLQTLSNLVATPGNTQSDEKPIGIKEACELLSVTEPTLRDWRKKGLVPYRKIGDRYYFFRSELLGGMERPQRRGRSNNGCATTGNRAA